MGAERRETTRLIPKKQTFVAMRPDFTKLGKLQDISEGGLCFQYMAQQEEGEDFRKVNVDIFISDNGYYLPGVPAKLVYEKKVKKATSFPVDLEYRLCGLKFDRLTNDQIGLLSHYLAHNTVGEA